MYTLGDKTELNIRIDESYSIDLAFDAAIDLKKGDIVKLTSTGKVDAAAASDLPFVVSVGAKKDDKATVKTPFNMVIDNKIAGTGGVTTGALVATVTESSVNKFKAAGAGEYAVGIALSSAAKDETFRVGILRSPFKLQPA